MSKRFGRNQRRRAREALAQSEQRRFELADSLEMARDAIVERNEKLSAADRFARDVARIVGREAIIAGVPMSKSFHIGREQALRGINCVPREPLEPLDLSLRTLDVTKVRYEVLRLLDVRAIADAMRRQIHLRAELADQVVGYAISESALFRLDANDLVRELTPEIARQLAIELKKHFK